MKKVPAMALVLALCLLLCACDSWMDGSYQSIKPHQQADSFAQTGTVQVSSYTQLYQALCNMVAAGTEQQVFYISSIDEEVLETYLDIAIDSVKSTNPIGAYAVDDISCEVGTNTARTAVSVAITYNHSRSDILRIKRVVTMDDARDTIYQALRNCDPNVVIMVESYQRTDLVQQVADFVASNPKVCMEMPQVSAAIYPEGGSQRVIELTFVYQNSREDLRQMQAYVEPIFRAATLNVSAEEGETTKFARMYAFLMERSDYRQETSLTPSYSLLRHGVGDSRAFAQVYAAMCREAGLECLVITGSRNGEPWTWNLICCDGVYYHVDLLSSLAAGKMIRLTDDDMQGYVWDYAAYPAAEPVYQEEPTQPQPEAPTEETVATEPEETLPAEE